MHALAKYCRKESFGFQFRNVNLKLNKLIFCKGGRYGNASPKWNWGVWKTIWRPILGSDHHFYPKQSKTGCYRVSCSCYRISYSYYRIAWFTTRNLVESCGKVGKVKGSVGKVYDGGIRYGEGAHYPGINPTLKDGWIYSRWLSIVGYKT